MKNIELSKDSLFDLIGQIIGFGIDTKDHKLCDAARMIETLLNLDDLSQDDFNEFNETSKNEGYNFIIE